MKKILYLPVLLLFLVSCSSSREATGVRTPSSSRTSSSQYPGGQFPGIPLPGTASSSEGLPPGQAKKVYGKKSAKEFAPGQQKKANGQQKGKKMQKGKKK